MRIYNLSEHVGVEITGIDITSLAHITPAVVQELRRLLSERSLLLFRNSPLTSEQHLAFASRIGKVGSASNQQVAILHLHVLMYAMHRSSSEQFAIHVICRAVTRQSQDRTDTTYYRALVGF